MGDHFALYSPFIIVGGHRHEVTNMLARTDRPTDGVGVLKATCINEDHSVSTIKHYSDCWVDGGMKNVFIHRTLLVDDAVKNNR